MSRIEIIMEDGLLNSLISTLSKTSTIAVDTESNGFYAYHEKTCLIQISDGHKNYIIDCLAVKNCHSLNEIFSNENIEKILHHGVNDISGLYHDWGIRFRNVFDTYLACQLLGMKKKGLAFLLEKYFGVIKDKKGQRYNWSNRPLKEEYITYAALDTHYLIPLANHLKGELLKRGLLEKAEILSNKLANRIVPKRKFSKNGYTNIKGYEELDEKEQLILINLYRLRDEIARKWNVAPFRVVSDETLMLVTKAKPSTLTEIESFGGFSERLRNSKLLSKFLKIINQF